MCCAWSNVLRMSKMLQVRNVPDELHRTLKIRAANNGMTLSDYVLSELEAIAEKPTLAELSERIRQQEPVDIGDHEGRPRPFPRPPALRLALELARNPARDLLLHRDGEESDNGVERERRHPLGRGLDPLELGLGRLPALHRRPDVVDPHPLHPLRDLAHQRADLGGDVEDLVGTEPDLAQGGGDVGDPLGRELVAPALALADDAQLDRAAQRGGLLEAPLLELDRRHLPLAERSAQDLGEAHHVVAGRAAHVQHPADELEREPLGVKLLDPLDPLERRPAGSSRRGPASRPAAAGPACATRAGCGS